MNPVVPQSPTAGGSGDDDQSSFPAQVRQAAWPFGSFSDGSICRALSAIRGCSGSRGVLGVLVLTVILAGLHAAEPAATTPQPQPPMLSGCEFDYPPYCVPKHGKADGFSVELLRAALAAVGQTVSFKVADWDEIKQGLAAGRLQVLPMVSRTPEREALYDFTPPYLTMHGCLVVREDNADIHSTADLKGKQVATAREKYAEEYLRRANLGAVIVPLPSFTTALQELSGGKHDAVVVQKMVALQLMRQAGIHNLKIIGPPIPDFLQAICFAVSKGDNARLALLNEGLAIVMANGTYQQVYAKWFTVSATAARSRPLIVACDADFPPFTFSQPDTTVDGFAVALWKAVAKEQGLPFELRVRPWGQLMEEFKAGKIDVLICTASSDERRQFARFSVVHSTDHGGIFVRTDDTQIRSEADLVGKSIIVVKGDLAVEHSIAQGWQQQLVLVEQAADGFRLLASGQHDAVLISKIVGAQTLKKEAITTVHALPVKAGADRAFSFAVQRDDVDLLATLNEGLAVCKANGTYDALYDQWLGVYDEQEISFLLVMRHIWPYVVGSLIVFLGLVIGLQYWRLTERKQAEDALRALAETQTAILNALPAHIALLDPQGVIVAVNDSWRRFGSANALQSTYFFVGRNYLQVCESAAGDCSQEARQVAEGLRAVLGGTRRDFSIEYPCHSPNEKRWFRLMVTPLQQERLAGVVVMHVNVTERRSGEEALRDSETRWRFAIEGAGDGVWDWDVPTSSVYFSPRWKQMLGYADDEISNGESEWSSRVHPDDLPGLMAELQPHLDGHTPSYVHEFRVRCKDGSYKWILGRGLVMSRDAAGRPQRMVGTISDITERKLAESAARDSESRFRALFDSATESIITMDEAGMVLSVNRSAETVFGYTAQDLIGTRLEAILPTPHREQHPGYLRRYLDTGEKRIIGIGRVVEGLRKDGSRITMHLSISEARTGQQRIFMGMLRDLTAERLAAETKKQLEAQLFQALKMESLGVLAGGIAHDFNNILTSILGYSDLAMQWNATDARTVKALGQVIAAGHRARDLVKQILDFSRRDVQTQTLCDLGHLVDEVGALMQVSRPKNIAYQVSGSEQKHLVMGDSSQIHQVLTNLCVNAIQAMPDGGRLAVLLDTCTFATGQPRPDATLRDEHYCRIRVQDSGTGIPAHIQARIFEPFFSTKGALGTGLGLSVVHGIIARHRGAITVDSQSGTGTVFTIYLPTVGAGTRMPSETKPAMSKAAGRILLIAETASLRTTTQDMLTQMGYTVDVYKEPALALAVLTVTDPADLTLRYDLVLSELAMTELNGIQVCEKLRALQRTMPIGVMAPNLAVSDWEILKAAGASFILTAPFTYFELAREMAQSVMSGMTSSKEPL